MTSPTSRSRARLALVLAFGFLAGAPDLSFAKGGKGNGKGKQEEGGKRDKDKDKDKDDEKDPRDTPEWKELDAIGAEILGKRTQSLLARMRTDGTLDLRLGSNNNVFKAKQAETVLKEWFATKEMRKVRLRKVTDLVGSFDLSYRVTGEDKITSRTLQVTVERTRGGFVLTKIRET